jgi:hypothetical protein
MLVVSHKPRGLFDSTLDSGITTALVKIVRYRYCHLKKKR